MAKKQGVRADQRLEASALRLIPQPDDALGILAFHSGFGVPLFSFASRYDNWGKAPHERRQGTCLSP